MTKRKAAMEIDMFSDDFDDCVTPQTKVPRKIEDASDNWDDANSYYNYRAGEVLNDKYVVESLHGKGVFSTVVLAVDMSNCNKVAIKIIRNNQTMQKAGKNELTVLERVQRPGCVTLFSSFTFHNHLCMVFEPLHMNVQQVLKQSRVGMTLEMVQSYARQLLIALEHLRSCGVLHCDIKPVNLMVDESMKIVKLCDFGSAVLIDGSENPNDSVIAVIGDRFEVTTPHVGTPIYRAPEVILGSQLNRDSCHAIDMWSLACSLYEMYTGKVLFEISGQTTDCHKDLLRLHAHIRRGSSFTQKMLKKSRFANEHFGPDHKLLQGSDRAKTMDILGLIDINSSPDDNAKLLSQFKHLLNDMLNINPERRLTSQQALKHPFFVGESAAVQNLDPPKALKFLPRSIAISKPSVM